jgi:hypothetical protein
MVNATIDNQPVSIQLNGTTTTVPSNETWVVRIVVHSGSANSEFRLNGIGRTGSTSSLSGTRPPEFKMTLTGGDTLEETRGNTQSMVSVQGFVVDS